MAEKQGKYVLSASDFIEINGIEIKDFGSEDVMTIDYPNDSVEMRVSANGFSIASRADGNIADVELTVIEGSDSDILLNNLLKNQNLNLNGVLTGKAIKNFNKNGGDSLQEKHNLNIGSFSKKFPNITISSNASVESVEKTYTMRFLDSSRDFV